MVNPNRFYTYAYLREDRTPYYIGKGTGKRIYSKNRKGLKSPKDRSRIIFLKRNITEQEAFKHEIYMIAVFGRKDLGTGILHNRTDGGEGCSGFNHSEETKEKIRSAVKGRTHSEGSKVKISESKKGENNYFYGKSHSEETKRKMSAAAKNMSENHKAKISAAAKGRLFSEETRAKLSAAAKNMSKEHRAKISEVHKGKTLSEETKAKMSAAKKGKTHSEETKAKISAAVKDRISSEEYKAKMRSKHESNNYAKNLSKNCVVGKLDHST
jgi:hypothetical protein